MAYQDHSNRASKAFTLIELLVVISIIALLIAMLLPGLEKARKTARQIQCGSQQRQFTLTFQMYAQEHDDYLPIASRGRTPYSPLWSAAIAHYSDFQYYTEWSRNDKDYGDWKESGWTQPVYISLGSAARNTAPITILQCPQVVGIKNIWGTRLAVTYGWNGSWNYGLGANQHFNYLSDVQYPTNPVYKIRAGRQRLDTVLAPSTTVTTADWADGDAGFYEYKYHYQLDAPDQLAIPHNDRGNVLWFDGHVSTETNDTLIDDDFDRRK